MRSRLLDRKSLGIMTVEPYDEPNIEDDDDIIRRVNPDQHVYFNENTGEQRISTKLFSPSSKPKGGMSVDILKLIVNNGVDAKEFVTTPVFTGSVCFKANAARTVGLIIGYDPILGIPNVEDNPYHGEVWRADGKLNKFTRMQQKALIDASDWFVGLPGVEIKA